MDTVGQQNLWSFSHEKSEPIRMSCTDVRKSEGILVDSYLGLAQKIAALQFMNRDLVLMFRGQSQDYRNKNGNTTLKPSIFRLKPPSHFSPMKSIVARYEQLSMAEAQLASVYGENRLAGSTRLKRQRILRWSILQHYEVVPTPLLDVTHSLRVAASFATISADEESCQEAYIFVLGIPNLSGAITASADAGIQTVRLSSICPASALRPHIQEGYLLGEYPEMASIDQTHNYRPHEIDFGRRLVAKFRFNPSKFWAASTYFSSTPKEALYPSIDPMLNITAAIAQQYSGSK